MSHEAHHDTHQSHETTTTVPFRSSVWFVIILAGLFIASVNFVNVMGHDDGEGHGGGHGTEAHQVESATTHEATAPAHEAEHATTTTDTAAQHTEEAHAAGAEHAEHH